MVGKKDLIMDIPTCLSIERRSINILIHHRVAEDTIEVVGIEMMRIPSIWKLWRPFNSANNHSMVVSEVASRERLGY